ncbi:MAG: Holliday junction branch migration protein RuvA [Clostridia bacterium]|nr:Holliday junction branch migration protein RuvA [Clostridia bacterium]
MLYSLKGTLIILENNFLVVECGGVGYKCLTSLYTQSKFKDKIGNEITVYTFLNVRQDALDLFGFADKPELECFKMLTSVSGVGPKAALSILSQFPAEKVASIVTSGDSKSLTSVSGIGGKTAQRIVLELKDKLSLIGFESPIQKNSGMPLENSNVSEAVKALSTLGYSAGEVMRHISSFDENLPVEELIKLTLKSMAKAVK